MGVNEPTGEGVDEVSLELPPPPRDGDGVGAGVGEGEGDGLGVGAGADRLDTVIDTGFEVRAFPAASLAIAVRVWLPLETPIVFHEPEYGGVVSSTPRSAPSSLNWTPTTPMLSDAFAESAMLPETVPPVGDVMETAGGVVSGVAGALNVALTEVLEVTMMVHVPVPEHPPPLQPANIEPDAGEAVRVMAVPLVIDDWVHREPQLMDPPVMVPEPAPDFVTVNV